MDDIRVYTSDIQMNKSIYEWHTDNIPVHRVNFFKVFYKFPFKISGLNKNSLHAMTVLFWFNYQIKKGSGISFSWTFSAWFFIQMLLIKYSSIDEVSMSYLFYFARSQTKCVINSYFVNWWRQGGGDEGKAEMQKLEYLESKNKFLIDEVKRIFHNYLRVIICWIKEK